jgi:hypothetical protein
VEGGRRVRVGDVRPASWKEVYPYEPMRRSQPADDYWAAKVVAHLTQSQLEALVQAADYREPAPRITS